MPFPNYHLAVCYLTYHGLHSNDYAGNYSEFPDYEHAIEYLLAGPQRLERLTGMHLIDGQSFSGGWVCEEIKRIQRARAVMIDPRNGSSLTTDASVF